MALGATEIALIVMVVVAAVAIAILIWLAVQAGVNNIDPPTNLELGLSGTQWFIFWNAPVSQGNNPSELLYKYTISDAQRIVQTGEGLQTPQVQLLPNGNTPQVNVTYAVVITAYNGDTQSQPLSGTVQLPTPTTAGVIPVSIEGTDLQCSTARVTCEKLGLAMATETEMADYFATGASFCDWGYVGSCYAFLVSQNVNCPGYGVGPFKSSTYYGTGDHTNCQQYNCPRYVFCKGEVKSQYGPAVPTTTSSV